MITKSEPNKGIVVVTMRNDPVNAMSPEFLEAFERTLAELQGVKARVVIITGTDAHFSAGGDLTQFEKIATLQDAEQFVYRVQRFMNDVAAIPVPLIAAINGPALGGGLELALACDIRVASRTASLGLPESRWGLLAGAGGTQRLARLIGPGAAKLMMYTGRPVDATEAHRIGLVDVVTTEPVALSDAMHVAGQIAANSPKAVRNIKRCVDEGLQVPLDAGLAIEREYWSELIPHGDHLEGATAFFERRAPKYQDLG